MILVPCSEVIHCRGFLLYFEEVLRTSLFISEEKEDVYGKGNRH